MSRMIVPTVHDCSRHKTTSLFAETTFTSSENSAISRLYRRMPRTKTKQMWTVSNPIETPMFKLRRSNVLRNTRYDEYAPLAKLENCEIQPPMLSISDIIMKRRVNTNRKPLNTTIKENSTKNIRLM